MANRSTGPTSSTDAATSWRGAVLLGIVFIVAAFFILSDIALATVISTMLLGCMLLIAGAAEIFQAFSATHWGGLFLKICVGVLYAACGLLLIQNPSGASEFLTLLFAIFLIASGVVRLFQAYHYWHLFGRLLLASGIVGILAGLVVLSKWPMSGLWVLGLMVGLDVLLHGVWWVVLGWRLRQEQSSVPA